MSSDLQRYFQDSPFNELMEIAVEPSESSSPVVSMPFHEKLTNQAGTLHGGVLASLIDVAGAAAVLDELDGETDVYLATTDLDIRYLRPVSTDIEATGTVERVGSSLGVATVGITESDSGSDDAEDAALGSVSFKLLQ